MSSGKDKIDDAIRVSHSAFRKFSILTFTEKIDQYYLGCNCLPCDLMPEGGSEFVHVNQVLILRSVAILLPLVADKPDLSFLTVLDPSPDYAPWLFDPST